MKPQDNQSIPWNQRPIPAQVVFIQQLTFYPALTLMVFIRKRIGVRMLRFRWILALFLSLQVYAVIAEEAMDGNASDVRAVQYFSIAFLVLALLHLLRAWRRVRRGEPCHSYSSGTSRLENRMIPRYFHRMRRIYRIVDPLYCLTVAGLIYTVSPVLALWIAFSAACMKCFEQLGYEAALERDLDLGDSLFEADVYQQTAEHFSGRGTVATTKGSAGKAPASLPAGIGADVEAAIARRRSRETRR